MKECSGSKFILNGDMLNCEMFESSRIYEGKSVYEVLRMSGGSPVFFDDHIERLMKSLSLLKKDPVAGITVLKNDILRLSKTVKKKEYNLKIVFNYSNGSQDYLIYFIEAVYPSGEQYRSGVKGTLYEAERNDPETKVIDMKLRSMIYAKLLHEGAYEALLVNKSNEITEGSRSNIFFIRGSELVTAPNQLVLNGITRKHIIELCRDNDLSLSFSCVKVGEMPQYDSVFMTGTSPVVLPFNNVDNINFKVSHPYIEKLRKLYIMKAEESIRNFRQG